MSEQPKEERIQTPESLEDQKYTALQSAAEEVDKIMREIDKVFAATQDRAEAEKIVIEKYVSQMEEAMKNQRQALKEWLNTMPRDSDKEKE